MATGGNWRDRDGFDIGFVGNTRGIPIVLDEVELTATGEIEGIHSEVKTTLFRSKVSLLLLCVAAAFGQLNTGTITGTVTDSSSALVPNVK